jgi:beta-glucosidase
MTSRIERRASVFKTLSLRLVLAMVGMTACQDGSDPNAALERRVDELVSQMTLEEKILQMAGSGSDVAPFSVPGVERLGVPPFEMSDGPRGVRAGGGTTQLPVGMMRGATWDPEVERRVGEVMGSELRAAGGNILLAPTINILSHPSWGRAQETYGEDVHHLSRMAVAFVEGVQGYALANPKHYAANNIENTRFEVDVNIDERTLREIYLPHFRAAVLEGKAASVMTAYNKVNGEYCAENDHLIREILKTQWGFDGFALSDWILGTRSTVPSALAGLDIEMPAANFYGEPLLDAVVAGEVPEELIDDSIRRMVRKKLQFRLDEPSPVDESIIASAEHLAVAQEAAEKGAVLLKNESAALPLAEGALTRIAVVGLLADTPNTGDTGSSDTSPSFIVTPLQGIEEAVGSALAIDHIGKDTLEPADEAVVQQADAAIVVTGLTSADEGEGVISAGDRLELGLSPERVALIQNVAALNPRTIVVLEGGSAITMGDWLPEIEALLIAWYPGQMGGHAIANLLFGATNPSGKLPLTIPKSVNDLPPFDAVSTSVTYQYFHGYRHIDREGLDPQFEFGFGLSYTTFEVDALEADQLRARAQDIVRFSVDVTNTGPVAGAEVVQLYVTYPGSVVPRANLELKGFKKVVLDPGETQTVEIELPVNSLAYYDVGESAWVLEGLTHDVHVGTSSRDLPLSTTLTVNEARPVALY